MQRGLGPITIILVVAVVVFAALIVNSREFSGPVLPKGPVLARGGMPPPVHDATLGMMWSPAPDHEGLKVMGFRPPPHPSPLVLLGISMKDTITEVNGEKPSPGTIIKAIRQCQKDGTPVEFVVYRRNKRMELRVERIPPLPGPLGEEPEEESEEAERRGE